MIPGRSAFSAGPRELRSQREVRGFLLEEIHYCSGHILPRHAHSSPGVFIQFAGECRETWNGRDQVFGPGAVTFRVAGDRHSSTYLRPTRLLAIGLLPSQLARLADCDLSLGLPLICESTSLTLLAHKIARNMCSADPCASLIAEGAALEILGALFHKHHNNRASSAALKAEGLLRERFKEQLCIWEISKQIGVHPTYLARQFRRVYSMSIGDYVRQLRIRHVCDRLTRSSTSVSEVAHEAGFTDHSHLCRTFKAFLGMAPSEFRRSARSR